MTNREISTRDAPAPFSHYSQAIEIEPGKRILQISGQVGTYPDGTIAPPGEQHEVAWRNVFAILNAAGMNKHDITEVTAYVTSHDQISIYRTVRDQMLEGAKPASTLIVAGLANPEWTVEIAVTAAK